MMTPTSFYLNRRSPCPVALYRELYRAVGAEWYWHERNAWSDDRLAEHLANPNVALWVVSTRRDGSDGYFELVRHDDGTVEIAYFGVVRALIGQGIGGHMLTVAAQEAFAMGATRVWLHTCTLDSPNALPSYKARGFREFKTEQFEAELDGLRVVSERMLPD